MDLTPFKKASIWVTDLPEISSTRALPTIFEIPSIATKPPRTVPPNAKIANEFFRYVGGKHEYGLLGTEYVVNDGVILRTEIVHSDLTPNLGDSFNAISPMITDAHAGLTGEFVPAVHQGVAAYFSARPAPSANLLFNFAITDAVGSSGAVFEMLAESICCYFFSGRILVRKYHLEMFLRSQTMDWSKQIHRGIP